MAWRTLTRDDLIAKLSETEANAFSKKAWALDPIPPLLAMTCDYVRDACRSNGNVRLSPVEHSIPGGCVTKALDYAVFDLLKRIGVSVGKDTYKDTDHAMTPHFGADEAREMVDSGLISVQSHTFDMHQWPPFEDGNAQVRETLLPFDGEADADYEAAVEADFAESRELLESITGQPVNALAFPEGAYVTLTQDALRSAGAELTFTTVRAVNTVVKGLPQSLCAMPRFGMTESTDMTALVAELEQ